MGYTLSCGVYFDSAHFLTNHNGPCKNIHGHRWHVIASVKGDKLIEEGSSRGMVIDFKEVKSVLKEYADSFDHKLIYEQDTLRSTTLLMMEEENFELAEVPFRPTCEEFSKFFFDKLKEAEIPVSAVQVYETPENSATYSED